MRVRGVAAVREDQQSPVVQVRSCALRSPSAEAHAQRSACGRTAAEAEYPSEYRSEYPSECHARNAARADGGQPKPAGWHRADRAWPHGANGRAVRQSGGTGRRGRTISACRSAQSEGACSRQGPVARAARGQGGAPHYHLRDGVDEEDARQLRQEMHHDASHRLELVPHTHPRRRRALQSARTRRRSVPYSMQCSTPLGRTPPGRPRTTRAQTNGRARRQRRVQRRSAHMDAVHQRALQQHADGLRGRLDPEVHLHSDRAAAECVHACSACSARVRVVRVGLGVCL